MPHVQTYSFNHADPVIDSYGRKVAVLLDCRERQLQALRDTLNIAPEIDDLDSEGLIIQSWLKAKIAQYESMVADARAQWKELSPLYPDDGTRARYESPHEYIARVHAIISAKSLIQLPG